MADAVEKELEGRRKEIAKEVELIFKANMKFTNWDVPEADNNKSAKIIIEIMKEEIAKIEKDILDGKYDFY